jgi:two-component system NarL family response regulator
VGDRIKVVIVDDDDVYRRTMGELLEIAEGIAVVGEARDGQKAVSLVRETDPDVILWSIGRPHAGAGEPMPHIHELFPRSKILILHDEDQEQLVLDVLRKGALGHLVKGKAQPAEIVAAIRAVGRGEAILSPSTAGRILDEVVQEQQHNPIYPDGSV